MGGKILYGKKNRPSKQDLGNQLLFKQSWQHRAAKLYHDLNSNSSPIQWHNEIQATLYRHHKVPCSDCLTPKNFVWYCLVRVLLVLCIRKTLCDVYTILCQEPHYISVLDKTLSWGWPFFEAGCPVSVLSRSLGKGDPFKAKQEF